MSEDHGLNPRQLKFAQRILDGDCTQGQAALDAGYAKNTADAMSKRLLENVGIAAYIAKHRAAVEEKSAISRERAAECMREILEGRHKENGQADATGRIGAYNALAKTFGWNEPDEVKVTGSWVERIRGTMMKEAQK